MNRRARILYVVPSLAGGPGRMVQTLATSVDRGRFDPEILSLDGSADGSVAAGIPVTFETRAPGLLDRARSAISGSLIDHSLVARLADRLRRHSPDVVHAHGGTALVYAALAARVASAHVPVVYTEHDYTFPETDPDRTAYFFGATPQTPEFTAGKLVDRAVVAARWLAEALVEWEGVPASRIDVVPNAIDGTPFEEKHDVAAIRRSLGVAEGAPLACCVARLEPVKNHFGLLAAWRKIADIWPGATLLLAGDGSLRDALTDRILSMGLSGDVRVLGDRKDVPRLLAASDFHLLASHSEGMSLTLLEAMAAGKPSIATAVGGNTELLADGKTGVLVPAGDMHAFAASIASFIQDPHVAEEMGRAAREAFRRRFTLDAMIGSYEGIYAGVLAGAAHAVPGLHEQGAAP